MPDIVNAFVLASDKSNDYTTYQIKKHYNDALEEIDYLFSDVSNRDEGIWLEYDADPYKELVEFDAEEDRGFDWTIEFAAMSAASCAQYLCDNAFGLIVKPLAYREQVLSGFSLTEAQTISAAKRGTVGLDVPEFTRFERIRSRALKNANFVSNMSPKQIFDLLVENNAIANPSKQVADAMGYVARMTNHRPGSTQFKSEVSKLIDHNSKRAVMGMSRRATERMFSLREASGDGRARLVWMGEGGKNTCGFCLDNFGLVKTYDQWSQDGMPGADICAGMDLCKCSLVSL